MKKVLQIHLLDIVLQDVCKIKQEAKCDNCNKEEVYDENVAALTLL